MRRKALGRDLGLTVRMALALALVGAMYAVAALLLGAMVVGTARSREWDAFAGALCFAVGLPAVLVVHVRGAPELVLRAVRARVLEPHEEAELQGLVARAAAQADLPTPSVAIVRSSQPNAFAVGVSPERAVIGVTTELLRRLNTPELGAVVAHELAHIANRDSVVMTLVGAFSTAGAAMRRDDDWRMKVLFVLYLPVYALGLVLQWTISRYREYSADRGAVLITGAPEHLMSALQAVSEQRPRGDLRGGAAVSAFCIVSTRRRRFELFADHPPLEKRLENLARLARELGKPVG